jgi:hypothetical protein
MRQDLCTYSGVRNAKELQYMIQGVIHAIPHMLFAWMNLTQVVSQQEVSEYGARDLGMSG